MKAVVVREFGDSGGVGMELWHTGAPGPREVLLRVRAIGVNYPDTLVIAGKYQILPPRPFVPGKDAAGTVLAVGAQVTRCKPGDRVMVTQEAGCYAEQVIASEDDCYLMPAEVSFEQAAALGLAYQTAYFALMHRADYRNGETVLVNGATGGVGMAAIQLAKCYGARVLAGVRSDEQAALARDNGADHTIDLRAANLRDALREQVYSFTNGRGADVILDPVGGDVFDASLRALAWCGRLVVIGFAAGRIPLVKANYLLLKNIAVSGLQWSDYRTRDPDRVRAIQRELFHLVASGALHLYVMRRFPLAAFANALAVLTNGQIRGRVLLVPDGDYAALVGLQS